MATDVKANDSPDRRGPPRDEDAERGVLGSALVDGARVLDLCRVLNLSPEAFYRPAHRILYETMLELYDAQDVVDAVSLCGRLEEKGLLESVGGRARIAEWIDATPTAAHAEYYIGRVRDKHTLRRIMDHSRKAIEACYSPDRDVAEILNEVEHSVFDLSESRTSEIEPWADLIRRTHGEIESLLENRQRAGCLSTGFASLDKILLGFRDGEMVVLAARPSMGKTSLAMNIAEHIAGGRNVNTGFGDGVPRPVAVFSLEMSRMQLAHRMLCSRAGVHSVNLQRSCELSRPDHERLVEAADSLSKVDIFVDDTPAMSALELRARARRLRKRHGIRFVVVDYLQLIQFPQYAREGRQREVAAISAALKAMARELGLPVLVVSQLNRAPETRSGSHSAPRLSDLRDSGAIEQDADVVLLLRRPSRMSEEKAGSADPTEAIVDIAKNRNGQPGEVNMVFHEDIVRFWDRYTGPDQEIPVSPSYGGVEE